MLTSSLPGRQILKAEYEIMYYMSTGDKADGGRLLTREQAIKFLKEYPVKFGQLLGFTKLTEIHNDWIKKMAFGRKDYTLQGHRSSYKTTCLSVALALIIILLPNKRTLFMRKTDDDVKEIIKQVRNILQNPKTQYFVSVIYGVSLKLNVDNSTELATNLTTDIKGTSQLVGIGTGSSLTGQHYDYIFTDDIINIKDRVSRAERERIKTVYQELINIKNKGGKIFNTGTPWHKSDAFGLMPEPEQWNWKRTGIFTDEEIEEIKDSMSPSLFAANYELRHIAAEDVIFSDAVTNGEVEKVINAPVIHVDAAYGGEDYTAMTICRKTEGKYYIYGRLWHKAVDECMSDIDHERKRLLAGKIYCETNADKGYLAKAFRESGAKVITYAESMNKYIKIVTHLKGDWKNVIFVKGTDSEYIEQILDYNEFAEHDDAPDSAACAIRILHNQKNAEDKLTSGFGF